MQLLLDPHLPPLHEVKLLCSSIDIFYSAIYTLSLIHESFYNSNCSNKKSEYCLYTAFYSFGKGDANERKFDRHFENILVYQHASIEFAVVSIYYSLNKMFAYNSENLSNV